MDFLIFSFWFRLSSSSTSFLKKHSFLNKCGSKESSSLYAGAATLVWIGRFYSFCYMKWGHSRTIFRHICQHMFLNRCSLHFSKRLKCIFDVVSSFHYIPNFLITLQAPNEIYLEKYISSWSWQDLSLPIVR